MIDQDYSLEELKSILKIMEKDVRVIKQKSVIDNRPMRSAWTPDYLKMKGIVYKEFVAKHGKQKIWEDLESLTVSEFESQYAL